VGELFIAAASGAAALSTDKIEVRTSYEDTGYHNIGDLFYRLREHT